MFLAVYAKYVRLGDVNLRQGANSVRRKEFVFVQEIFQDPPQSLLRRYGQKAFHPAVPVVDCNQSRKIGPIVKKPFHSAAKSFETENGVLIKYFDRNHREKANKRPGF